MYIRLFQKTSSLTGQIVSNIEFTSFLKLILEHIDPKFDQKDNPSKSAKAWKIFNSAQDIYKTTTSEWTRKDATKQFWKAVDTSYEAHTHLRHWWSAIGNEEKVEASHTERVFANLKSSVHRLWSEKKKTTKKHKKHVPHWLRTPLRTNILSCDERGSPGWCTDCNVLDNCEKYNDYHIPK